MSPGSRPMRKGSRPPTMSSTPTPASTSPPMSNSFPKSPSGFAGFIHSDGTAPPHKKKVRTSHSRRNRPPMSGEEKPFHSRRVSARETPSFYTSPLTPKPSHLSWFKDLFASYRLSQMLQEIPVLRTS